MCQAVHFAPRGEKRPVAEQAVVYSVLSYCFRHLFPALPLSCLMKTESDSPRERGGGGGGARRRRSGRREREVLLPCLHRPHRDQFRFQVASDRDVNHSFASETCGVEEGAAQCRKPITTPEIERPVGCEGKVRAKTETAFIKPKAMISV